MGLRAPVRSGMRVQLAVLSLVLFLPVVQAGEPSPPDKAEEPKLASVEDLQKLLNSKDDEELYQAVQDLGLHGPDAAPAAKDLLKIFTSDKTSKNVQYETALALGRIGPAAKDAVPALIEALKSSDVTLRGYAAEALGCIGPDASAAVQTLTVALRDSNKSVKRNAAKALGRLKTDDGLALAALEDLRDRETDNDLRGDFDAALQELQDARKEKGASK